MEPLLLAAALASSTSVLPDPQSVARNLAVCGFSHVAVEADESLQEDVVVVSDAMSATNDQAECAARVAVDAEVYIRMPEQLARAYWAALMPLEKEKSRRLALIKVERQGLLDRMPRYQPDRMSDRVFASQLETFCGPRAQGALQSEYGPHSISPAWVLDKSNSEAVGKALECLLLVASANGFDLGFIGNEAVSSELVPAKR